jgi:energy-coupling factor transporter ATP-binding protein EcfA2
MIEIKNLHHRYPDGTHALRGIDLSISQGEFLLICGSNGSGKTTLMRLISGLFKATTGSIRVTPPTETGSPYQTRHFIGMVFQDADSQIVGETVREDVSFGPENLGLPPDKVAERVNWALRLMGLEIISEKPCYLLSGGEKRRVAIAGVLAMGPDIILFDEPFSHLDYPATQEVLRHMITLHQKGHTLVVTTHDVEKVIAHVDRVAIIHQGELKVAGPPDDMVAKLSRFGIRPPCYALLGRERISWLNE